MDPGRFSSRSIDAESLGVASLRGLEPAAVLDALEANDLLYTPEKGWGFVPHMLAALPEKLGGTAIGKDYKDSDALFAEVEGLVRQLAIERSKTE